MANQALRQILLEAAIQIAKCDLQAARDLVSVVKRADADDRQRVGRKKGVRMAAPVDNRPHEKTN